MKQNEKFSVCYVPLIVCVCVCVEIDQCYRIMDICLLCEGISVCFSVREHSNGGGKIVTHDKIDTLEKLSHNNVHTNADFACFPSFSLERTVTISQSRSQAYS